MESARDAGKPPGTCAARWRAAAKPSPHALPWTRRLWMSHSHTTGTLCPVCAGSPILRVSQGAAFDIGKVERDTRVAVTQYAKDGGLALPIALDLNNRVQRGLLRVRTAGDLLHRPGRNSSGSRVGPLTPDRARAGLEKAGLRPQTRRVPDSPSAADPSRARRLAMGGPQPENTGPGLDKTCPTPRQNVETESGADARPVAPSILGARTHSHSEAPPWQHPRDAD